MRDHLPSGRRLCPAALLALLLVLAPSGAGPVESQAARAATAANESMPVPPDLQVPLLLKVLTYDRNFERWAGEELRIGIIVDGGSAASRAAGDGIAGTLSGFSEKTVKRLPIRYSVIEFTSEAALASAASDGRINVLYISPGNAAHLESLLRLSRARHILTATGVPEYVERGVAVGIGVKQDRPQILIHLTSSKSAGSEFDASLLRIAKVVR